MALSIISLALSAGGGGGEGAGETDSLAPIAWALGGGDG